jgi:hypothetical protein
VYIYGPGYIAPDVTSAPATSVAPTSATLNGSVNPDGVDVTDCHFEWGTDTGYGNTAPCVEDVGDGTTDVSVHADVSGLASGTGYHYRLVASNANGTATSGDQSFSTPPPPTITAARAYNLDATSVDLSVQINPNEAATTYRFEYGTSTSYGSSVPIPDGDVGSGASPVTVGVHLSGLSANTTYHWRVVAENASGATTTRDHTFVYDTGGSPLPDNRAYEQVTPAKKNAAVFDRGVFMDPVVASSDGNRMILSTIQCFEGAKACGPELRGSQGSHVAMERSATGWVTRQLTPPATEFKDATGARWWDADSGAALFAAGRESDSNQELVARMPGGEIRSIGAAETDAGRERARVFKAYASADMSRVVFSDEAGLLGWPFDATFPPRFTTLQYVDGAEEPILVGVSGGPGSTELISECGTMLQGASRDVRTVIFVAWSNNGCDAGATAPPVNELWARIDESESVKLSARSQDDCSSSACQSSDPKAAEFIDVSDDGSRVLFTSEQQLTDDATDGARNLYLYDFAHPSGDRLTALTGAASPPNLDGVVAVNRTATHAYFVAGAALTTEANERGEMAIEGAKNLYLYRRDASHPSGALSFVATLDENDGPAWAALPNNLTASVTPSGRYLAISSRADLAGEGPADNGAALVYRFDAQTGEMITISSGRGGFNDSGRSSAAECPVLQGYGCSADASIVGADFYGRRVLSDDGRYVVFESPAALTPGATDFEPTGSRDVTLDTPVYAQNVYRWHDGQVALIANGRGAPPLGRAALGTDASGKNVFFTTHAALSAADTDNGQLDVYTARICSEGDPCVKAPIQATPCIGDACQGGPSAQPGIQMAGTVTLAAPGN